MESSPNMYRAPLAFRATKQNKNKTLSRENISPRLFSSPFFSICTCIVCVWATILSFKRYCRTQTNKISASYDICLPFEFDAYPAILTGASDLKLFVDGVKCTKDNIDDHRNPLFFVKRIFITKGTQSTPKGRHFRLRGHHFRSGKMRQKGNFYSCLKVILDNIHKIFKIFD